MQFAILRYRNIVCRVTGCPPALLEFHTQGGHDTVDVVSTSFFLVTGVGGVESVLDWLLPLACPFHEERVSQAARRCSVLCWFSAECLPDSARLTQNSARLGRVLGTRCAHTGVSGPTPGGARPPPLMFCLIPWPTQRSPALWWGRYRFHPVTYPEPYRHGISLRENTESIRML